VGEMVRRYGVKVEVFEPVREFAAGLRKRFAGDDRILVNDFGLAGNTREEEISLASESSSVLRGKGAKERIRLVAAREVFQRIDGEIAVLKVNIEGCEYELLEHLLDAGLMRRVRFLQVQFHDFVAGAREKRRAIRQRLRATHCERWNYPFIWEGWERISGN